ncbi:MAG: hypothetical protein R3D00_14640 [Bacteroidia bacterium]
MVIRFFIGLIWVLSQSTGHPLSAQTLHCPSPTLLPDSSVHFTAKIRLSSQTFVDPTHSFQNKTSQTPDILPSYAKENPSGYSWLCRMELKIEDELPVGLWVKAGDSGGVVNSTGNNLHIKLKLFRF